MKVFMLAAIAAGAILAPMGAQAQPIAIGGGGFTFFSAGSGSPSHIWTTGDYWNQSFAGTGTISSLSINLSYDDNVLALGNPLGISVELDGNVIGSFTINPGNTNTAMSYSFADIALDGTDDLRFVATNTIAGGAGSVSLNTGDGASSADVPEPASMALLGVGLAGIAALRRRRR